MHVAVTCFVSHLYRDFLYPSGLQNWLGWEFAPKEPNNSHFEDSTLKKLALKTHRKFQNSKIGISSIIHRDDMNMSAKLSAVNGKLKEMANNDDFVFIDNSHIDGTCLNGSKLHSNAKGSAYLANKPYSSLI